MYNKLLAIILIMLVMFTNGCKSRVNRLFDYNTAEIKQNGIVVTSQLIGTFKSDKDITFRSSPYELLININCGIKKCNKVVIDKIEIVKSETMDIVYAIDTNIEKPFVIFSDGSYNAQILIKNINIDYYNYVLKCKMSIYDGTESINSDIQMGLFKEYKEYKRNELWDKLMGV